MPSFLAILTVSALLCSETSAAYRIRNISRCDNLSGPNSVHLTGFHLRHELFLSHL